VPEAVIVRDIVCVLEDVNDWLRELVLDPVRDCVIVGLTERLGVGLGVMLIDEVGEWVIEGVKVILVVGDRDDAGLILLDGVEVIDRLEVDVGDRLTLGDTD
jgi:hypothetical protein